MMNKIIKITICLVVIGVIIGILFSKEGKRNCYVKNLKRFSLSSAYSVLEIVKADKNIKFDELYKIHKSYFLHLNYMINPDLNIWKNLDKKEYNKCLFIVIIEKPENLKFNYIGIFYKKKQFIALELNNLYNVPFFSDIEIKKENNF
ncbi:hypothetical protein AAEX28_15895 [Lentisphaerota bacterium WC36G]|nr:hypothetical protein LJT99_02655 [Lentisphaerae bacterium WC36]